MCCYLKNSYRGEIIQHFGHNRGHIRSVAAFKLSRLINHCATLLIDHTSTTLPPPGVLPIQINQPNLPHIDLLRTVTKSLHFNPGPLPKFKKTRSRGANRRAPEGGGTTLQICGVTLMDSRQQQEAGSLNPKLGGNERVCVRLGMALINFQLQRWPKDCVCCGVKGVVVCGG